MAELHGIKGKVDGKDKFYKYLRCTLAERILSLSCWMERQRMENNSFVLVKRCVSACVGQNGESERQIENDG